jgi:exopolyphosphatase/guanosine-5'-triphosphate,3'-diphosphate pyrophosphatase
MDGTHGEKRTMSPKAPGGEFPFGLLEMGSNSLKFYLVRGTCGGEKLAPEDGALPEGAAITTHKFPWKVAHEFFLTRGLTDGAVDEVIGCLRAVEKVSEGLPLSSMLAVATGVFREIANIEALAARVRDETGVRLRVISGQDEAKLMARDYQSPRGPEPAFLFDLGGATTEWACFESGAAKAWGSLPLGAIRNEYLFPGDHKDAGEYLQKHAAHCDEVLARLPVRAPSRAIATGGTAKAVAQVYGSDEIPLGELRRLLQRVLSQGPPPELKKARQAVFLPGLVILWRLLVRCRAEQLVYGKTAVRDGMAGRLVRLLGTYKREDLHATLLLNSTQIRKG